MIYDRDYFREPERRPWQASIVLIWVLLGCFFVQCGFLFLGGSDLIGQLGLGYRALGKGEIWRILTYQLLHEAPWPLHVLSNVLGLYFLGPTVEDRLGKRPFLLLYGLGGIIGGLAQVGFDLMRGAGPGSIVVGASAGVSAISAAFCRLYAHETLNLVFLFFPIRLKARVFLWVLIAGSVIGLLIGGGSIAHMAHLGGMAVGWFGAFGLPDLHRSGLLGRIQSVFSRSRSTSPQPANPGRPAAMARTDNKALEDARWQEKVDTILEKISEKGLHSLSGEDRRTLEEARRRMNRR